MALTEAFCRKHLDDEYGALCRKLVGILGLIVDARHVPREIQEEAFRKGLIPYIPGDRGDESAEE